ARRVRGGRHRSQAARDHPRRGRRRARGHHAGPERAGEARGRGARGQRRRPGSDRPLPPRPRVRAALERPPRADRRPPARPGQPSRARGALSRRPRARRHREEARARAPEWHDLGDAFAAIDTYRAALADDADDADAFGALAELYAHVERWPDLCALLEDRLARVEGDAARALRARLAEVAAAHGDDERARTQCALLLEDPGLAPEHVDAVDA